MPCLSEHEQSGAIGMLKAEVRGSDVAIIIAIRQLYSASETVKDRGRSGQPKWQLALRAKLCRLCIDDIYIDDIRSSRLLSVPEE